MGEQELRTGRIVGAEVRSHIEHWRRGRKLWEYDGGDRIGSSGLNLICDAIGTRKAGRVQYIRASAIGTGVEALGTPQGKGLGSVVYQGTAPYTKSSATGSWQMNRNFSIGSSYAMRESALFVGTRKDVTLRGTMYSRGTYPVRNVVVGDTITLNYKCGFISG
jgi:hypothetical protein